MWSGFPPSRGNILLHPIALRALDEECLLDSRLRGNDLWGYRVEGLVKDQCGE